MEEFRKLGLSNNTIEALKKKGFTKPTSIQAKAIPLLLKGERDIVAQSQTGTGKTASFALPILETIKEFNKEVQAIILTPTRELASQVANEFNSLRGNKKIEVLAVYGGSPIVSQMQKLRKGVDIVVGTPGRVMDLQERGSLKLNKIRYAVLDEADEMLNMGFVEDIENILKSSPKKKNMLLFSATMPKPILKIAKKYMREYDFIEVDKTKITLNAIEQIFYNVNARERQEALRRVIDFNTDFYGIVFCNTKENVNTLSETLIRLNYKAAALHGDITQNQREKILKEFKNKNVKILVATDVAARGIDVNDLTHVINYSLPQSPESYVHRIGRTGRAGKKGIAITFVIPSEKRKVKFVEKINNCTLTEKPIPSIEEILLKKEEQIQTIIKNIIESNRDKTNKYSELADSLLKEYKDPKSIISAILKYSLKNQLEEKNYKNLSVVKPVLKSSGKLNGRKKRRGSYSRSRKKTTSLKNNFFEEKSEKKSKVFSKKKGKLFRKKLNSKSKLNRNKKVDFRKNR